MKKKFFAFFLLVCFLMFSSSFIYSAGAQESGIDEKKIESENAGNVNQSETRVIRDMRGRSVEIPVEISRAASVFPYVSFITLALGGGDVLVGIDSSSTGNENLMRTYPEIKDVPAMGMFFNVNPESILEADPQVVFTVNWDKDPDKTQSLLNVPVICVDLNLYKESIEFLSGIIGDSAESRANELISYYEEKKDLIKRSISKADVNELTKVYIAGGKGIHSTYGKESTWQYEIADAGGINVAADVFGGGAQEVSSEQIIIWDPEVIVLDLSCPDSAEDILNDEMFQDLSAVKSGRIYYAPAGFLDTFGRPHMESALARLWLADKLYPEEININITDEAKAFYLKFYGIELSDSEISIILNPKK
ncbi:MAG: ABC transporter substrate-binding protein [Spirochaetales bacterium]|nr:ABC transporter substrate-binding protein [Spirochaetales bacterium]